MNTQPFPTRAAEEAAIARYAAKAARMVRHDWRQAGLSLADAPATEIYDDCRDAAYDVLGDVAGAYDLVDMLLIDVTEAAVTLVMS